MMINSYTNMQEMMKDYITKMQTKLKDDKLVVVPSGFEELDQLTGGFENGKVYVIGGRPCMGKEELMLSMIESIVIGSKMPVLMFSTNSMESDYIQRFLAICCDIPSLHLHSGIMEMHEWERLDSRASYLVDAPLFIHDCLDLPIDEMMETARNCWVENRIRMIFIDCLQMIDFTKDYENSSERIAKAMYALKQLAREMNVPIVVGSMMSRGIEKREGFEGKQPQLMDLSNSSYIEELADVILMVHRPEYYHIFQDCNGRDFHGKIEILVMKNAMKPLDRVLLEYHRDTGKVCEDKYIPKTVCLEELAADNDAVKRLVNTLDLEELPF